MNNPPSPTPDEELKRELEILRAKNASLAQENQELRGQVIRSTSTGNTSDAARTPHNYNTPSAASNNPWAQYLVPAADSNPDVQYTRPSSPPPPSDASEEPPFSSAKFVVEPPAYTFDIAPESSGSTARVQRDSTGRSSSAASSSALSSAKSSGFMGMLQGIRSSFKGKEADNSRPSSSHFPAQPHHSSPGLLRESFLTANPVIENDRQLAELLQRDLNLESRDAWFGTQHELTCGICMDDFMQEDIANVDPCWHAFCRDCIRQHITSKLRERRFPIVCPICSSDTERDDPGVIDDGLLQQVGVPDADYAIYIDLQNEALCMPIHCRKCNKTMLVDRTEYDATDIINCPMPPCDHMWCKLCQQEVIRGGIRHSCQGSSQLNTLIKAAGWRRCPGCTTPIEKQNGCNHMSCKTPRCNTHFCYNCGKKIISSTSAKQISQSVKAHFGRDCMMF